MAAEDNTKDEREEMLKEHHTFDDLFDLIGHVGCYQLVLVLFGCMIEVSVCLSVLYIIYENANPGWTCVPVQSGENWTETFENVTKNFCPTEQIRCENLTYNDEYTTISTEWDLICESKYLRKVTQSTLFAAIFVGTWLGGFLADTYGRKKVIMIVWVLLMLLEASTGLAHVWILYLALRILVGICAGGLVGVTMVLPAEYLGPRYRSLCSYRLGWVIGGLLQALHGYLLRNWRWHVAANGLLMLPTLPIIAVFTSAFVSYGITSNISNLSGSLYLNSAILILASGGVRWTVLLAVEKLGRKISYYMYMSFGLACLVSVMIIILCDHDGSLSMVVTGVVLLSFVGTGGLWALVFLIPVETYPTLIRSRALAIGNASARIGGILAPQVGLLMTFHPAIPYLLYTIIGILACIFVRCFLPEMKGRPLPENMPPKRKKRHKNMDSELGNMETASNS